MKIRFDNVLFPRAMLINITDLVYCSRRDPLYYLNSHRELPFKTSKLINTNLSIQTKEFLDSTLQSLEVADE